MFPGFGRYLFIAMILLCLLAACYASGWVVIQIVKEMIELRRRNS